MSIQPGVGYSFYSSGSGFTLDSSPQFPEDNINKASSDDHPFKLKVFEIEGGYYQAKVTPGMINNIVPQDETGDLISDIPPPPINLTGLDTGVAVYVYLQLGKASDTVFPQPSHSDFDNYPTIYTNTTGVPTDSDEYGYILLAIVQPPDGDAAPVVQQMIRNSLWADRIKVSTLTARYFYAAV